MPSRPHAFFRAGSPPPDGRLCREIAPARSLRPSSSIGRFHGYCLELLAPVDVKPTRPWRVAIRGSRATDFKSEQKLNADDGRRGLTGHGSRPRDLQRRQFRRLKVLAGNRAPRRFVTRPRLQFPRSAAVPYLPPPRSGRSGSYASNACGSKLAGSTPSSPRRRHRPRDRSKQPRSSCCADRANLVRWYTAAKAATIPLPGRNGRHRSLSQSQKSRRNALTNGGILGLKSEGSRTM